MSVQIVRESTYTPCVDIGSGALSYIMRKPNGIEVEVARKPEIDHWKHGEISRRNMVPAPGRRPGSKVFAECR